MTRTSHKKNRPFDFKLISLVEPHPVLYRRHWGGLSTFECMKEKTRVWNEIGAEIGARPDFCLSRWNNLKNHFQRELRHCTELCPKEGIIRGSTWPYLKCMRFLRGTDRSNRTEKHRRTTKCDQSGMCLTHPDLTEEPVSEIKTDYNLQHNESFVEFEEPEIESSGTEETASLPRSEKFMQYRLTNFEHMVDLLKNIPNDSKTQVEHRIMAYLCKCQLRALVNEGIDDLSV